MARLRVIVADDDAAMRRWIRLVLARFDMDIREAASGWELLSVIAERPVDVVITDLRMPIPNGLSALAMLRAAGSEAAFLLATAFADEHVQDQAARLGATVLAKPFSARDLIERLDPLYRGSTEQELS